MNPVLLATALGDGSDAGISLNVGGTAITLALFTEGGEQAGGEGGTGTRQGAKQGIVGQGLANGRDLVIEALDGLQRRAQLCDEGEHQELMGSDHGQVVAAVEYRLVPSSPEQIKAKVGELIALRKAAQPTNKRTFGSVFKNPEHEFGAGRMLEACGLKSYAIGGAVISPKHANFIENAGGATTADALALMAEARHRAREQYGVELEHEVELLGAIEVPG